MSNKTDHTKSITSLRC